jgi:hypothetical protein
MKKLEADSPSVQSHLSLQQAVINRLAGNSASCKTWCVTLVSAIVVVVAEHQRSNLLFTALIPIILFFGLDAYYLGLERSFRSAYGDFVCKLHIGEATVEDAFILHPASSEPPGLISTVLRAMLSVSVWPFYATLALLLAVVARSLVC